MLAYEEDCLFADPFAGFNGVGRFKKNVGNLGGLMEDVKLDVYEFKELEDSVQTKWRFSCILSLPWKPRLAAGGSTTHELNQVRITVRFKRQRSKDCWDSCEGQSCKFGSSC